MWDTSHHPFSFTLFQSHCTKCQTSAHFNQLKSWMNRMKSGSYWVLDPFCVPFLVPKSYEIHAIQGSKFSRLFLLPVSNIFIDTLETIPNVELQGAFANGQFSIKEGHNGNYIYIYIILTRYWCTLKFLYPSRHGE